MSHYGYTNSDTYHVAATIDNVQELYDQAREWPTVYRMVSLFDVYGDDLFPSDIDPHAVNWQEIADRYAESE